MAPQQSNFVVDSSSPRRRGRTASLLLLAAVVLYAARVHALGPTDRRITSARTGISVEAPAGWTLSQHTGYSDTLVLLLHPDGSRISVSAASTATRQPDELYRENRPGLIAQGLTPTVVGAGSRGSLVIDLSATHRPDRLRQLYLVREVPAGRQAIVLTLITTPKAFSMRLAALDLVATRLTLEDPLPPAGGPRPAAAPGGASGAAAPPIVNAP